jgi:hypothetical protein
LNNVIIEQLQDFHLRLNIYKVIGVVWRTNHLASFASTQGFKAFVLILRSSLLSVRGHSLVRQKVANFLGLVIMPNTGKPLFLSSHWSHDPKMFVFAVIYAITKQLHL